MGGVLASCTMQVRGPVLFKFKFSFLHYAGFKEPYASLYQPSIETLLDHFL